MTGFETIVIGFGLGAFVPYLVLRLVLRSERAQQRAWDHAMRDYRVDLVTGKVRK